MTLKSIEEFLYFIRALLPAGVRKHGTDLLLRRMIQNKQTEGQRSF